MSASTTGSGNTSGNSAGAGGGGGGGGTGGGGGSGGGGGGGNGGGGSSSGNSSNNNGNGSNSNGGGGSGSGSISGGGIVAVKQETTIELANLGHGSYTMVDSTTFLSNQQQRVNNPTDDDEVHNLPSMSHARCEAMFCVFLFKPSYSHFFFSFFLCYSVLLFLLLHVHGNVFMSNS